MEIKWIQDADIKREIAAHILSLLPEWFGISESTAEYIRESAYMPFIALVEANTPIGFLSIKRTSPAAAEIYAMGIDPAHHRCGGGRLLMAACKQWCRSQGFSYLQVKTLDGSHPDPHYRHTRCFYAAMGFQPLECLSALWGEQSPCLLMVQYLDV